MAVTLAKAIDRATWPARYALWDWRAKRWWKGEGKRLLHEHLPIEQAASVHAAIALAADRQSVQVVLWRSRADWQLLVRLFRALARRLEAPSSDERALSLWGLVMRSLAEAVENAPMP